MVVIGQDGTTYTYTYSFTEEPDEFIVPAGVRSVTAYVYGAGGGSVGARQFPDPFFGTIKQDATPGGGGAYIAGTFDVVPNTTLAIHVGGGGGGGDVGSINSGSGRGGYKGGGDSGRLPSGRLPAGGGGGYSSISYNDSNILVAGAGGGGGYNSGYGGRAGGGGYPGGDAISIALGVGGGGTLDDGGDGGDGQGGDNGIKGSAYQGGAGSSNGGSGGGGGGYYGGGGGGGGAAGGGGSSYYSPIVRTPEYSTATPDGSSGGKDKPYYISGIGEGNSGTDLTTGKGSDGLVVITYTIQPACRRRRCRRCNAAKNAAAHCINTAIIVD